MNISTAPSKLPCRSTCSITLLVIAFALGAAIEAFATTVPAPGFPQMVARAEHIFTATVSSVQPAWAVRAGQRCIVTTVEFNVEQMHKGAAAKDLRLEFLGGTVGEDTMEVQGVPKFRAGERVILFSENNGRQFCPLVGIHHGKLVIERDARSGSDVVLRHDRQPISSASDIGADGTPPLVAAGQATIQQPLRVEAFLDALNRELHKGARP